MAVNPNFPNNPGYNLYQGARYVPVFSSQPGSIWTNTIKYDPLTIVLWQGNSYTSKTFVPIGIDITNTDFWAPTGNYNAQVEQYRQDVQTVKDSLTLLEQTGVTPEMFGAVGDGTTDDTIALNNALAFPIVYFPPNKNYSITNTLNINSSLVDGQGSTITYNGQSFNNYPLIFNINTDILVRNIKFNGNYKCAHGITVNTLPGNISHSAIVTQCEVFNLDNLDNIKSVVGIGSEAGTGLKSMEVSHCYVHNLRRTSGSPGLVETLGIGCLSEIPISSIHDNFISDITSPDGEGDSTGIHVLTFSSTLENPSSYQCNVYNNTIKNVGFRGIKLQCNHNYVYNNSILFDFTVNKKYHPTGIEILNGDGKIDSNKITILNGNDVNMNSPIIGFIGGENIANTQGFAIEITNNSITAEGIIAYPISVSFNSNNGGATALIQNNVVKVTEAIPCIVLINPSALTNRVLVSILSNTLIGTCSALAMCSGDFLNDNEPNLNEYLFILAKHNILSSLSFGMFRKLSNASSNQFAFHNFYADNNSLSCQIGGPNWNINNLTFTKCYYTTDGSTGGLINAPSGYTRYTQVETLNNFFNYQAKLGVVKLINNSLETSYYRQT